MKWWLLAVPFVFYAGFKMSQTRGFRNNNPGNLRASSAFTWKGQIGVDPKGFVIFDTMQDGIRALARTLQNYQNIDGLNTISGIINRWAPSSENNTNAYIASVSQYTGISPDQPINVQANIGPLVRAIIRQENGNVSGIAESVINQGIMAA